MPNACHSSLRPAAATTHLPGGKVLIRKHAKQNRQKRLVQPQVPSGSSNRSDNRRQQHRTLLASTRTQPDQDLPNNLTTIQWQNRDQVQHRPRNIDEQQKNQSPNITPQLEDDRIAFHGLVDDQGGTLHTNQQQQPHKRHTGQQETRPRTREQYQQVASGRCPSRRCVASKKTQDDF